MMTIVTNPAPVFGRTAGGLLAARLEDHSWIAVPARTGLRIANAWRLKKAMADWTEEDFWGSCGIVANEAAFRDHVAEIAEHHRELRGLPRPTMVPRRSTPWGPAQQSCRYGEGISCHSTAGHGGFHLDDLRNAAVHPLLRHANGWYEEDCDWAKVAFTFPGLFTTRERRIAAESLIAYYPDAWEAIHDIELAPGQSRVKDERRFREVHAADWIVISAVRSDSHPGMVDCVATMGGARGAVPVRHYRVPVGEYAPGAFGFVIDPDRHEQVEPSALSA